MSLSVSLGVAQSGLSVTADQTAVVSRNIANQGVPGASRKNANVVTAPGGGIRLASITRVTNDALFRNVLVTTASSSTQDAVVEALDRLDQTVNDPELDASPAAKLTAFDSALRQYADSPSTPAMARNAVAAANDLAVALNSASQTVQQVRQQADDDMAASVDKLNSLLSQFESLNLAIVKGTRSGTDVTDQLDARDNVLTSIAEQIGVRVVSRADNDMALYTDSGVTLFDVKPRAVTFDPTNNLSAGITGNAVLIDGVPVTGSGGMPASSGRLVGLAAVRDDVAVTYQSQLDEIARGLIEAFAESDQSAVPTLPDAPGLFTWSGGPAMPPGSGTVVDGLASSIHISPLVDPAQGGNPDLVRDGGIAGVPDYVYNPSGASGFSDRLHSLVDKLAQTRSFDPVAQAGTSMSLANFASSSVAWLEQVRSTATSEKEYRTTLLDRSTEALSKIAGVNLDEEMTNLLDLERSYQASSKLVSTIDQMFQALLSAVG
ncbi:MAG TPA: flagellar hook-associated protein FlgK [Hyphomicrobiaceae bacterium]|nr:flagellar hook-associated protein FlgK [Hyphomicrobiaceae bacterium]